MAIRLTGPDPTQAVWPIPLLPFGAITRQSPSSVFPGGSNEFTDLTDGSDNTWINTTSSSGADFLRYQVRSTKLPFGARVSSVYPVLRGNLDGTGTLSRNDFMLFQGDHAGPFFTKYADHPPYVHFSASTSIRGYTGQSVNCRSDGQLFTQNDLDRGLFIGLGINPIYGSNINNVVMQLVEARIYLAYDLPPTAAVTYPATGTTVNDTASPLVTWDYVDDFQPQAAYQVALTNSAGVVVYDSGKVATSATYHQVPRNLPNDTYTVALRVYQAWSGPGGAFPALALATSTFTVNVLKFAPPRVTTSTVVEDTVVQVYPDLNLLNFDDSTFDRGPLPLSVAPSNASVVSAAAPVLGGAASAKVTVTAAGAATVTSRPGALPCNPADVFNAIIYANPVALTARTATFKINFRNAAGGIISTVAGSAITLAANTWTPLILIGATAPPLTVGLDYAVTFAGTSAADALYLDNAAVWHGGGGTRTNLITRPSFEDSLITGYSASGSALPVLSLFTTDSYHGTKSLKVTAGGANTFLPNATLPAIATVIGAKYTVSAWVKLPAAGAVTGVYVLASDVGSSGQFGTGTTAVDTWSKVFVTFVATATSHTVKLGFSGTTVAGNYFLVDAVMGEQIDSALTYFDGSSPGATWTGVAFASTSTLVSSFPVWARGGFFEVTPNLLTYADSTVETDNWVWQATAGVTGPVTVVAGTAAHGARYLQVTSSGLATADVTLGSNTTFSCAPGDVLYVHAAGKAATTARPFSIGLTFYNAAGGVISTLRVSATDNTSTWTSAGGSITAPALAASFTVVLQIATTSGSLVANEVHQLDAFAVYRATTYQGFMPGYFPSTDPAPTVVVEYQDDGVHWKELGRRQTAIGNTFERWDDYTVKSGVTRTYRAWLTEVENGQVFTSDYAAVSSITLVLLGVWMAADFNPAGTSKQYVYDGAGRVQQLNSNATQTPIEGRAYPFSEFGSDFAGQLAVTLQLPDAASQANLLFLAGSKSEVVFRDQRGRALRGLVGNCQFTDEVWGQTATFTFQVTGVQP